MDWLQRKAANLALVSLLGLTCGSWHADAALLPQHSPCRCTLADSAVPHTQSAMRCDTDTVPLLLPRVHAWPRVGGGGITCVVTVPGHRAGCHSSWPALVVGYSSELPSLTAQHIRLQI